MAVSLRIDEMIFAENGTVRVKYTRGETPLPLGHQGAEQEYGSKQAFAEAQGALVDGLTDDRLIAIAAAPTFKAAPTMPSAAAYSGKTITLDFAGAQASVAWS